MALGAWSPPQPGLQTGRPQLSDRPSSTQGGCGAATNMPGPPLPLHPQEMMAPAAAGEPYPGTQPAQPRWAQGLGSCRPGTLQWAAWGGLTRCRGGRWHAEWWGAQVGLEAGEESLLTQVSVPSG